MTIVIVLTIMIYHYSSIVMFENLTIAHLYNLRIITFTDVNVLLLVVGYNILLVHNGIYYQFTI